MKRLCMLVAVVLCLSGVARAESVADTLVKLSSDVEALKKATTSLTSNNVSFFDSGKQIGYLGNSTANSGLLQLSDPTYGVFVSLSNSPEHLGGSAFFFNRQHAIATVGLTNQSSGGAWFYRGAADNESPVAFIGANASGSGEVDINGQKVLDYSEVFEFSRRLEFQPGSVMSGAPDGSGLLLSSTAYDPRVVGVIAGAGDLRSGMRIGSRADGTSDLPLAVAGQVFVRVCAENGAIHVGDLLVSSSRPGIAMRGSDPAHEIGTIVGKAIQPYDGDANTEGLVRMLVMNR